MRRMTETATLGRFEVVKSRENGDTSTEAVELSDGGEGGEGGGGVRLERTINMWGGFTLLVGCIVGSGIFVSPKVILEQCGGCPLVALAVWLACGGYAMLGALCYAELGVMIPKSGGDYAYILRALGPFLAYVFLWVSMAVTTPTSSAILALTFAKYTTAPFVDASIAADDADAAAWIERANKLLAVCAVFVICFFNCYSVRLVNTINSISTACKVGALSVIICCGAGYYFMVDGSLFTWTALTRGIERVGPSQVATAFYGGVFTFNGWAYLNFVTEEIQQPEKNLPRSIFLSLPTVTAIYVLVNAAYFAVLDVDAINRSSAVAMDFTLVVIGRPALVVIPLCVALSCLGGLNGTIFSYSRMFFAGARDGRLPELLAMINVRHVTPMFSVMLLCGITIGMVVAGDVETLMTCMAFAQILIFGTVICSLLRLRCTEPHTPRPLKMPLVAPLTFLVVTSAVLGMSLYEKPLVLVSTLAIIAVGVPPYFLFVHWQCLPSGVYAKWVTLTHTVQKLLYCVTDDSHQD